MELYNFKPVPEFWRSLMLAVLTVVMQAAIAFDPATVESPRAWLLGVLVGVLHAVGTAVLHWVSEHPDTPPAGS